MKSIRFAGQMMMALMIPFLLACGRGESPELPPVGFKVEFGEHTIPTEMAVGQALDADISVRNISERRWPNKPNREGRNAVNLSYHWIDKKGRTVVFDGLRTPLPHDLDPGKSVQLKAAIQAPDRPGLFNLEVTLVQEGVAWFPEEGGAKLVIPVNVVLGHAETAAVTGHEPRSAAASPSAPSTKSSRPERAGTSFSEQGSSIESSVKTNGNQPWAAVGDQLADARDRRAEAWTVQVGSYPVENEAQLWAKTLRERGYDSYVAVAEVQGRKWHRVRVGRLASREEAQKLQKMMIGKEGFKQALITNR